MVSKTRSIFLWIFAVLFTLGIAYYQRTTGPTYPVRGKVTINNTTLKYKLLTSNDSDKPAEIVFKGDAKNVKGYIKYRKYKSSEEWVLTQMSVEEGKLIGYLPQQPPAGKLTYNVTLIDHSENEQIINDEPIVIRFKGPVPGYVLYPHILFMFLAMMFSTRTGIEALLKGSRAYKYSLITVVLLLLGGMTLGPIVQKYAFGEFWTGWPFGKDLTDNKTLVAFIAWIIAFLRLRKNPAYRGWAIAASIILLMVYLIPHSMFGSELDYSTGDIGTGK